MLVPNERASTLVGTPGYIAPEILMNEKYTNKVTLFHSQ
jgi:serine/threonine protein kinase